ncbi:uncharacterized protein DDB_G0271670-like [Penaeus japonicus]|uniref:uncharacterized protein DDB_G0271670-like n=1 Tax=Penaeus japonicus TaxID=27405 RepID=UPI001C7159B8|nr:uncharacterized protein DDB_G0271670-like [Penaeus japonicus]
MGKTHAPAYGDMSTSLFIKSLRDHHSIPVCQNTNKPINMCECHRRYRNGGAAAPASSSSSSSSPSSTTSSSSTSSNSSSSSSSTSSSAPNLHHHHSSPKSHPSSVPVRSPSNCVNGLGHKQVLKEKLIGNVKNAKNANLSGNRYKNYKGSPKWKVDGRRRSTSTESVASSRSEKSDKGKDKEVEPQAEQKVSFRGSSVWAKFVSGLPF